MVDSLRPRTQNPNYTYKDINLQVKKASQEGVVRTTDKLKKRHEKFLRVRGKDLKQKVSYSKWYRDFRKRVIAKEKASRKTTGMDRYLIPWIPVTITGTGITIMSNSGFKVPGHGRSKYVASWLSLNKNYLGVVVNRTNKANTSKIKRSYIGNANQLNRGVKLLTNTEMQKFRVLQRVRTTNSPLTLVKNQYSGPSVAELSNLVSRRRNLTNTNKLDLLSIKLIGDRFTADTARWVNSRANNYIIKPYDKEIGSIIIQTFYSGLDFDVNTFKKLTDNLRKDLFFQGTPNFIYSNSAVFTNDKLLALYCIKTNTPCVIVLPVNQYYFVDGTTSLDGVSNNVLNEIDTLDKLAILDCLHDFAGSRSGLGFIQVLDILKSEYKGEKYENMWKLLSGPEAYKKAETAIKTEILENVEPGRKGLPNIQRIVNDNNYALSYDAGPMDESLKARKAGSIHRVLDSATALPGDPYSSLNY